MVEFLKELGNPHNGVLGGLTVCVMGIIALEWLYKLGKFIYGEAITWYKSKKSKDDKFEAVDAVQEDNEKQDERLERIENKLKNDDFEHRIPALEDGQKELLSKMNGVESCVSEMSEIVQEMRTSVKQLAEMAKKEEQDGNMMKQKVSEHKDSIIKLSNSVNKIGDSLETNGKDIRDFIVASARSTIYRMYSECHNLGYITKDAYHTLVPLLRIYRKCGGNDIVHDHIEPYLMSLPIRDYDADGNLVDYAPSNPYRDRSDGDNV